MIKAGNMRKHLSAQHIGVEQTAYPFGTVTIINREKRHYPKRLID